MRHETVEKSLNLMIVLIVVAISIGGLVEIVPLMFSSDATEPDEGITVYSPLRLAGRDIYVREGCYNCHSQMVRPFRSETERYGPYTTAGETVYDRPFQFGSKRTGPDLARVGGRYSDDWQRLHLMDPRALVPASNMPGFPGIVAGQGDLQGVILIELDCKLARGGPAGWSTASNMPGFPWLAEREVDGELITAKLKALRFAGDPYTDEMIAGAAAEVEGKTELDALVAYLQGLGTNRSHRR